MHFEAAVEAKKHIFCEKPMGTDATGVRRFMAAAKKSRGAEADREIRRAAAFAGLVSRQYKRLKNGEIGDIVHMNANWVGTPVLNFNNTKLFPNKKRDPKWGDLEWQQRNWYSFLWICGDQIVEQHLHNIDVCNWFMGGHPVEVVASGGAAWRPREEEYGNIYDHMSADFVYADGVHMSSYCRQYQRQRAERQRAHRRHQGRDRFWRTARREVALRSLRAGAHGHGEQHPGQRPVHQRGPWKSPRAR